MLLPDGSCDNPKCVLCAQTVPLMLEVALLAIMDVPQGILDDARAIKDANLCRN